MRTAARLLAIVAMLAVACLVVFPLHGCKTVQGAGEDIKSVGEAAEKAIKKPEEPPTPSAVMDDTPKAGQLR